MDEAVLHGEDGGAGAGGHAGLVVDGEWVWTVEAAMNSSAAIRRSERPRTSSRRTSTSRPVRPAGKPTRLVGWWPAASRTAATVGVQARLGRGRGTARRGARRPLVHGPAVADELPDFDSLVAAEPVDVHLAVVQDPAVAFGLGADHAGHPVRVGVALGHRHPGSCPWSSPWCRRRSVSPGAFADPSGGESGGACHRSTASPLPTSRVTAAALAAEAISASAYWPVRPCCPVRASVQTPVTDPVFLMRVRRVLRAPATSTVLKAPLA